MRYPNYETIFTYKCTVSYKSVSMCSCNARQKTRWAEMKNQLDLMCECVCACMRAAMNLVQKFCNANFNTIHRTHNLPQNLQSLYSILLHTAYFSTNSRLKLKLFIIKIRILKNWCRQ